MAKEPKMLDELFHDTLKDIYMKEFGSDGADMMFHLSRSQRKQYKNPPSPTF